MNIQFRKLRADEIECRAQSVKEKGCSLLLYKDARCDMRILDEQMGAQNWQREHYEANNNLFCRVGIWDESKAQWIWKSDAGAPSNQDAEKGHASDSFKRACFNWGIGRELYTAGFIWVKLDPSEVSGANGKYRLNLGVEFSVKEISYAEDEIRGLVITDKSGAVRYDRKKPNMPPKIMEPSTPKYQPNVYPAKSVSVSADDDFFSSLTPPPEDTGANPFADHICDECKTPISDDVYRYSTNPKNFNRPLCQNCQRAVKKANFRR